jgi:hypothetical protein
VLEELKKQNKAWDSFLVSAGIEKRFLVTLRTKRILPHQLKEQPYYPLRVIVKGRKIYQEIKTVEKEKTLQNLQ